MQKFRTFWRRLLLPRLGALPFFALPAVIFLLPIAPFEQPLFRALSFLLSIYVLLSLSLRLPRLYCLGKEALLSRTFRGGWAEWWARATLLGGLLINLAYAVFRIITGFLTDSAWFCTEAVYYMVLCVIRVTLVEADRHGLVSPEQEVALYRRGGGSLLLLSLSAIATVALALQQDRTTTYAAPVVAVTVLFALWRVGGALWNVLRFGRRGQSIPLLAKTVSLSSALVSLFGLQGTLLLRFGTDTAQRAAYNAATGAFVCFSLTVMALLVLYRGRGRKKSR